MDPMTIMGLGAAAGGLLGGLGGSKQGGTTTTVSDIPEWLKPYATNLMGQGQSFFNQAAPGASPLMGASQDEMLKTIQGQYLNPDSNPYLQRTFEQGAGQIRAAMSPSFGHMQAFGSAPNQAIGRSIADFGSNLYGNNFQQERNRQFGATMGGQEQAFQPFSQFKSLMGGFGGTQSQPYFENKGANMFGGALAGASLGRMFGGK
jgi:hypothetical protein